MGKSKKRKHVELSQEEIWDDSALLRSWQDAMDEYQFYHSIHARGEDVEAVLHQAVLEDNAKNETMQTASSPGHAMLNDDMEEGEVDERNSLRISEQAASCLDEHVPAQREAHRSEAHQPRPHTTEKDTANASGDSSHLKHNTVLSILENMKMAYWWAGYYSALYDAQQTANPPSEK